MAARAAGEDLAGHRGDLFRGALADFSLAVESAKHRPAEQLVSLGQGEGLAVNGQRDVYDHPGVVQITGQVVHRAFPVADVEDGDLGVLVGFAHHFQVVGPDPGLEEATRDGQVVELHFTALRGGKEGLDAGFPTLPDIP